MTPPRVLLLDNYDSFVGNLYQYLGELGAEPILRRNDAVTVGEARAMAPTHFVVSPGPGVPEDAGVSIPLIRAFAGEVPILGVCLGHHAIGAAFGARVVRAKRLVHGKSSPVHHSGTGVLEGLPSPFTAGRYHSLALARESLPEEFEVTAWLEDGEVMAIRHGGYPDVPVEGVQFHPESVLTDHGHALLRTFLGYASPPPVAGLFETILVRGGRPVLLDAHLDRLLRSAAALGLPVEEDRGELESECADLPLDRSVGSGRMRVLLSGGRFTVELSRFPGYPPEVYMEGATAFVAEGSGHPLGARAGHKSEPYDRLRTLREEARAEGAIDVLFRDADGALLEGAASNLFLVTDGVIRTPPLARPVLPGVTRRAVIDAARGEGFEVREEDLRLEDVERAEEAFLTGSLMEVVPLRRLGEVRLRPGPVARKLLGLLRS